MDNDSMTRELLERQRRQDARLFGDGSDDNPGLIVRVDRIEGRIKMVFGALAAIGVALVTWCIEFLGSKLTGKP